jgi:dihydropyrimidinase
MPMYKKLIREDRAGFENRAKVHNTVSEDLSFNRVVRLAASIEGAALYMMHTSATTGVAAIAAAPARITKIVCPRRAARTQVQMRP